MEGTYFFIKRVHNCQGLASFIISFFTDFFQLTLKWIFLYLSSFCWSSQVNLWQSSWWSYRCFYFGSSWRIVLYPDNFIFVEKTLLLRFVGRSKYLLTGVLFPWYLNILIFDISLIFFYSKTFYLILFINFLNFSYLIIPQFAFDGTDEKEVLLIHVDWGDERFDWFLKINFLFSG